MITVYHNPRCEKSRSVVSLLEERKIPHTVVKYMDEPLTEEDLLELLDQLDLEAAELLRTDERLWREEFKDLELNEDELVMLMLEHPQLMQRPIVVKEDKAIIARPAEKVLAFLGIQ
jgi:arsenate reductase